MSKPSRVIILVEDNRQRQLIHRYLRKVGLETHAMRFNLSAPGAGSGEQWVRRQFAVEVAAYRKRRNRAETRLIVVIDADSNAVEERLRQFDLSLRESEQSLIDHREQIARLIPKRNVETWVLCLCGETVDEITDYKRTRSDWPELLRSASIRLYDWTRRGAQIPTNCVSSLRHGTEELAKLNF
jgi:hypothetical protein